MQPKEYTRSPEIAGFLAALRVERSVSPQTLRSYELELEQFGSWLAQEAPSPTTSLAHASALTVRQYLAELERQGYGRRTIARKLSVIRSLFRYMVRQGLVRANPASTVALPRIQQPGPSPLTEQDVTQILELPDLATPSGLRDKALLELLYATGLRVRELVSLNLHTIDFEEGWLSVGAPGESRRSVPVGQKALAALESYLRDGRPRLVGRVGTEQPLFLNKNGGRLSDRGVRRIVLRYSNQVASPSPVTPQSLRQAVATHLLARGAESIVVQAVLGHARAETTIRYALGQRRRSLREIYLSAHPRQVASGLGDGE